MSSVLLHICCGVCSCYCLDSLRALGYKITGLFFNPNIFPQVEYSKRLEAARTVCSAADVELMTGEYTHSSWQAGCLGLEQEKEGGARCLACYRARLEEAYRFSVAHKFDFFTTTLTVSPYKNSKVIFDIGRAIGGDRFLAIDFKKDDGFKKTVKKAKELNIYRQNYCGCEYSARTV